MHRAADELGRLLRTLFLCDYFSNEEFRREIHTLLNRGESTRSIEPMSPERVDYLRKTVWLHGNGCPHRQREFPTQIGAAMAEVNDEETKISDVRKTLGEPVFLEFTDPTLKARRNLLSVSVVAFTFSYWGLGLVSCNQTVFGVQLTNLTNHVVAWVFLWALVYLLIHFIWLALDGFVEWRVRLSGTKVAYQTAGRFTSQDGDYPSDPRQSTLYNWWLDQHRMLGHIKKANDEAQAALNVWANRAEPRNGDRLDASVQAAMTNTALVESALKHTATVLESHRVPESLARFDGWMRFLSRSQNLRWILVEASLPVVVGAAGIGASIVMLSRPLNLDTSCRLVVSSPQPASSIPLAARPLNALSASQAVRAP